MINSPLTLLPQQPAPPDQKQKTLSAQYLLPLQDEILELLVDIRNSLDSHLSQQYPTTRGASYPVGRCKEISEAVREALVQRLRRPRKRAERALAEFVEQGGLLRPIWGALRGRYFQNATQIGTLYVDVSNDTVAIIKPKVEILPLENSGLEPVRDIAHFRHIVRLYWKAELFANLIAPNLAPILPMISVNQYGDAEFQSASNYMVALAMRDQFRDAEAWLATGPAPPAVVTEAFLNHLPEDLRCPLGTDERLAAVTACQTARREARYDDMEWRRSRLSDYFRFRQNASSQAA
jgi:hypothetical protein